MRYGQTPIVIKTCYIVPYVVTKPKIEPFTHSQMLIGKWPLLTDYLAQGLFISINVLSNTTAAQNCYGETPIVIATFYIHRYVVTKPKIEHFTHSPNLKGKWPLLTDYMAQGLFISISVLSNTCATHNGLC